MRSNGLYLAGAGTRCVPAAGSVQRGPAPAMALRVMIAVYEKRKSLLAGHVLQALIFVKRSTTLCTCSRDGHSFNPLFVSLKVAVTMVTAPLADRLAESDAAWARGLSEEPPYNGERVLCGTGKAGTEQLAVHASPTRFGKCSAVKHPSGAAFKKIEKIK